MTTANRLPSIYDGIKIPFPALAVVREQFGYVPLSKSANNSDKFRTNQKYYLSVDHSRVDKVLLVGDGLVRFGYERSTAQRATSRRNSPRRASGHRVSVYN